MTTEILANPKILTEPVGATGIRYVSAAGDTADNPPPPIVERTIINRSEAMLMLQGHTLDIEIPPKLLEAVRAGRPAAKAFDDPLLRLTPRLSFDYMTEADIDPRTGMPLVKRTKKGVRVVASKFAKFSLGGVSFYSETSKMSAPSWSIPAGPQSEDGACAAADIFKRPRPWAAAMAQSGSFAKDGPDPATWICRFCYAGKSNYMHRTSQYSQTARLIWLTGTIEHRGIDGAAQIMGDALEAHMANAKTRESLGESTRFFRVHDSGDLTPDFYLMWRLICRRFDGIRFWCPTRMWVYPRFNELVRANPPPENLTLRPSALHFNNPAPRLHGYQPGSTAHMSIGKGKTKRSTDPVATGMASWECPAYKNDAHSCAGAGGPKGEKDCRFCWTYRGPQDTVSYRAH